MRDYETSAIKCHEHLLKKCPRRNRRKVIGEFPEATRFIADCEVALCRMALILGDIQPTDDTDESIRDLFSESFDSLLCAKNIIYDAYVGTAFAMMRRGYELMEMMIYFILKPTEESFWRKGRRIKQGDIRKFLETHPRGGSVKFKKELYDYFSDASHTNRKYMLYRQLGIVNRFTLGNYGHPNEVRTIEYLMRLVQLFAFLRHIVFTHYQSQFRRLDKGLSSALAGVSDGRATDVNKKLRAKFDALLPHLKQK